MINKCLSSLNRVKRLHQFSGPASHVRQLIAVRRAPIQRYEHPLDIIRFDAETVLAFTDEIMSRTGLTGGDDRQPRSARFVQNNRPTIVP